MNFWDPYGLVTYLLHTVLGSTGVLAALIALSVAKGKRAHMISGRLFVAMALVAASTAIVFALTRFAPLAIISSLMTMALLAGSLLALRKRTPRVTLGENLAMGVMALCGLVLAVMAPAASMVASAPAGAGLQAALYALFPLGFVLGDLRFRKFNDQERRQQRIRRHLPRMAFAFAIAVHAPIVSFSDDLGLDPLLAFFGPFVLWPLIIFGFRGHRLLKTAPAAS